VSHPLSATGSVTPQSPGRTPHRCAMRPGGETLLARGAPPEPPVGLPKPAMHSLACVQHDVTRGGATT
jgi:hypothetical protein